MKVTPEIFDWFHNLNIITTEEPIFEQYRKINLSQKILYRKCFSGNIWI